jgi:hypothetical protein
MKDLLADDRALDVVGAEVQGDLRHRHPHHDPVRLDMVDVVEEEPRHGDHLQVVRPVGVLPAALLEDGVVRVEGERDEGEEAGGLVLELAKAQPVVDPLLVGLDVAVEHRAVRRDPERVRNAVHLQPGLGVLLAGGDEPPDAIGEDLGAAAGQRAEPRVFELAQHLLVREAREVGHVVDLARREALEVHVRHRLLQPSDDLEVVVEVHVRALAADHVDLREAGHLALTARVLDELFRGVRVGVLLLLRDGEGAELALHAADVRLVQVEVLDEVGVVRAASQPPRAVGELAEAEQIVGLEQRQAVLEVQALAYLDLLGDRLEVDSDCNRHYALRSTTMCVNASSSGRYRGPSRWRRASAA